jgi:hypothetical protein
MATVDELRLAFRFIPDGEVIPADEPGVRGIRLRAVFHPQGFSMQPSLVRAKNGFASSGSGGRPSLPWAEAGGWTAVEEHQSPEVDLPARMTEGLGWSSQSAYQPEGGTVPAGTAEVPSGGNSFAVEQDAASRTSFRAARYVAPTTNGGAYEVHDFTATAIGAKFAGPGAPRDHNQSDPRIVAAQEQITRAAQDVMDQVNRGKIIVPANRATAGSRLHYLFAQEIKLMHIPGVTVEQSFSLGDFHGRPPS